MKEGMPVSENEQKIMLAEGKREQLEKDLEMLEQRSDGTAKEVHMLLEEGFVNAALKEAIKMHFEAFATFAAAEILQHGDLNKATITASMNHMVEQFWVVASGETAFRGKNSKKLKPAQDAVQPFVNGAIDQAIEKMGQYA